MAKRVDPLVILQDTREQNPWLFSKDVTVQIVTLPTGDYSLAGHSARVAIERKSLADLVQCVGPERERFMDCCRRLHNYAVCAVVVEASISEVLAHSYRSQTSPQSVLGTTIAIWVDYSVPTVWAGNAGIAANIVEKLFRRVATKGMDWAA